MISIDARADRLGRNEWRTAAHLGLRAQVDFKLQRNDRLRLYWGIADTTDSRRFSVGYELNGEFGQLRFCMGIDHLVVEQIEGPLQQREGWLEPIK